MWPSQQGPIPPVYPAAARCRPAVPPGTPGAMRPPAYSVPVRRIPQQPPPAAPPMANRPPSISGTRVDVLDAARSIGTQIAAQTKGFLPFDAVGHDAAQLRVDYERLRITLGADARHRPRARPRPAARQDPPRALQVHQGRPRRHPPARGRRQPAPARRPAPRRERGAHPGQQHDPQPRHQGARGRAHARRVDGLRCLEGQVDDPEPDLERHGRAASPREREGRPRRPVARQRVARPVPAEGPRGHHVGRQPGGDVHREHDAREEDRAGDHRARPLHAPRRAERRRADDQRQARGEEGRAARSRS